MRDGAPRIGSMGDIFKAADALQGVADTLRFDLQLRFIRDVAVNAARRTGLQWDNPVWCDRATA